MKQEKFNQLARLLTEAVDELKPKAPMAVTDVYRHALERISHLWEQPE